MSDRSNWEVKIFHSPEEAERHELNQYRAMTGNERVAVLIELIWRNEQPQATAKLDRTITIAKGA